MTPQHDAQGRLKRTLPKRPSQTPPKPMNVSAPMPDNGRGLGARPEEAGYRGTDVSKIAAEMMNNDSPLMRRAETQGMQYANKRGMLNSSMAAGASTTAALDQIVPMASQESSQRHARRLSYQEFEQAKDLSDQAFEHEMGLSKEQYRQNLELQERDQTFTSSEREATFRNTMEQLGVEQAFAASQSEAERAHAAEMLAKELHSDMELAQLDAATRENLVRIEGEVQERLTNMELDAANAEIAMDMFVSMHGQYNQTLQTIINNPDLAAEDRNALINAQQGLLDAQLTAIEGMSGVQIDFATGAVTNTGTGTGTPGPYPTTPSPVGPIAPVQPVRNENTGPIPGMPTGGLFDPNWINNPTPYQPATPYAAPAPQTALPPRPAAPSGPAPRPATPRPSPKPAPKPKSKPKGGRAGGGSSRTTRQRR